MISNSAFDFIVVGAGTTGSVVAARLSARGTVLLLEAGGSDSANVVRETIEAPKNVFTAILNPAIAKKYLTTPQARLAHRQLEIQQGSVRGGSSSINGMIYVRGNFRDYDLWAQLGNDGWSFKDVLPHFLRSEKFAGAASAYHGVDGPLDVRSIARPSTAALAFIDAVREVFPDSAPDWDFNGDRQENAAGLYQVTVTPEGRRASSAVAFLDGIANRSNLRVELGAQATRILMEGNRAVGVECLVGGVRTTCRAEREVIISAGAFASPKLLMLSGIGPADHLRARGIPTLVDLPGVGQNLHDHLQLLIFHPATADPGDAAFTAEAGLFLNSRDGATGVSPDLQFHVLGDLPGAITNLAKPGHPHSFLICPVACKPFSRGAVSLNPCDPQSDPIIEPNYLQCDADMQVLLRGIQWAQHFARLGELGKLLDRTTKPYVLNRVNGGIEPLDLPDTAAGRAAVIRQAASTVWHPAGTCRMGRDRLAVVDPRLAVWGVEGLRVADASVIPTITSGNTNAVCFMIGEVCAAALAC